MELRYSIHPFDARVTAAYRRLLPHADEVVRSGKLDWKYVDNPAGTGFISAAEAEGEIMGMIGSVSARLRVCGNVVQSVQAVDGVVDPSARGKGCFGHLARQFHAAASDRGVDAIFGFPNANAAPTWFRKIGWTRLGSAPFLFKPLRAGYFLRRLHPRLPDFSLSRSRRSAADVRPIAHFDERFDGLWERFSGAEMCAVDRSHDYLNWRLIQSPAAKYACFGLFDGERPRSFVATLITQKHGGRIGYIMEALGDDSLPELLKDAVARLKTAGAEALLSWCFPWSPNRGSYAKAGFLPLPRRFGPEINFGSFPLSSSAGAIVDPHRWYLSYLDSDTV